MKGDRRKFTCPACHRAFWYWILEGVEKPKVKCYYCSADSYPFGEPPAPPPAPPKPAPEAATPEKPAPAPTS
jgi:hypothetical protein